jgi:hypothetical protein
MNWTNRMRAAMARRLTGDWQERWGPQGRRLRVAVEYLNGRLGRVGAGAADALRAKVAQARWLCGAIEEGFAGDVAAMKADAGHGNPKGA